MNLRGSNRITGLACENCGLKTSGIGPHELRYHDALV